jgi:hypothetical protein
MRYAVDPRQKLLFDPGEVMFSPVALRCLREDWPGLFRSQLLHMMPVGKLGERFHPWAGCPTKELYGMAGVIFLKEFFDLTIEEAVRRCLFDLSWHYALNIVPNTASMGHATIERYMKLFADSDLAADVFYRVTSAMIEALDLDISRQRLDSTHVFSDMASFGRTKLMGVTIKRFLTQLKRHHRAAYDALPDEPRERYAPSQATMFGGFKGERNKLRQMVAEDLLFMVNRFADDHAVVARSSYKAMQRILCEQCQVSEDKTVVKIKAKPPADALENPSDPDATYDGRKGQGYQAQIAETCGGSNDVQLITAVQPEPAHCSDQDAVLPMLDQLEAHGRKPEVLYADTGYGSDRNVVAAEVRGVDLQSPVGGAAPTNEDDLTLDDFVIEESQETVTRCPNGCQPRSSAYDPKSGRTITVMRASDCSICRFRAQCPVQPSGGRHVLRHTPAQRRLASRRAEQTTEAFEEHYAIRAGAESLNSGLKRRTGLGRLRTRGRQRVRMAVLLRCAGWNLLRALAAFKKRRKRAAAAVAGVLWRFLPRCARLAALAAFRGAHLARSAALDAATPTLMAA